MKNKQKIAFFNIYKIWGGGEKWHFEMAKNLRDKGHQVYIFGPRDGELSKRSSSEGIEVIDIQWSKYSYFNIFKILKLITTVLKLRLNVVLFNSFLDVREASLWFWISGVKKRIFRVGMPIAPKKNTIFKLAFKYGLTHINYISKEIEAVLESSFSSSLSHLNKSFFTNGIDINTFTDINKKETKFPIIVGNCVRLAKQKRLDLFLDVANKFKDNPNVHFIIAGEGEERQFLENLIIT